MATLFKKVSARALHLDYDLLQRICSSTEVISICTETVAGHKELKRNLPAVTWQSNYEMKAQRGNKNAVPTGLYIIDMDGVEEPQKEWERICKEHSSIEKKEIVGAHITPSGKGLRLICLAPRKLKTIAECQQRMARVLNIEIDEVTKDFARLSFLVKQDMWLKQSPKLCETFDTDLINPSNANAATPLIQVLDQAPIENVNKETPDTLPDTYKGVAISEIIDRYITIEGGVPEVGQRNVRFFGMAMDFRYIMDFNPQVMVRLLPHFDLPESEVLSACTSACRANRASHTPFRIENIVKYLVKQAEDEIEVQLSAVDAADRIAGLPPLPPIFRELTSIAPPDFKAPTILALLPVIGTLCSKLRAEYLDMKLHAPNFFTVVEAPQASGKSFTRELVDVCLAKVREIDRNEMNRERIYEEQRKLAKNAKEQPTDPRVIVRVVPATISIAKLLKRLDQSQGLHLFSYLEELDTLTKSNSAGAWSQKTDIYRNAYDNAEFGQDYMSENSYSTNVHVFYNLLCSGTPKAVARFFRDPEDGLCSRILFVDLPSQFGKKMPQFGRLTNLTLAKLDGLCACLNQKLGYSAERAAAVLQLDLNYLNTALADWLEEQRIQAIADNNLAQDIFRRRCAVNGFRAGMLAHLLYNEAEGVALNEQDVIQFATWVAQESLRTLLNKFAKAINDDGLNNTHTYLRNKSLFAELSQQFSRKDVEKLIQVEGVKTPARIIIFNWLNNGLACKQEDGTYKKTSLGGKLVS